MTKKDYIKIAAALAYTRTVDHREVWGVIVNEIADILAADNARFDRERFYAACSKETTS